MSLSVGVPDGTHALFMIQFRPMQLHSRQGAVPAPIEAMVDGTAVFPSADVLHRSGSSDVEARTAHWVAGLFAAGNHLIKIRYSAP